jgi:hypothetical protein
MSVPLHQLFAPPVEAKKRPSSAVEPIDDERVVKASRSDASPVDIGALDAAVKRAVGTLNKFVRAAKKVPTTTEQWADLLLEEIELAYNDSDECAEYLSRRQRKYARLIADKLQVAVDEKEKCLPLVWLNPFRTSLPPETADDEHPCIGCASAVDASDSSSFGLAESPYLCGRCLQSLDCIRDLIRAAADAHLRPCTADEEHACARVRTIKDDVQIEF